MPETEIFKQISENFIEILKDEPNLIENIDSGLVIVGDLHGNIDDLLHIVFTKGLPDENMHYLFLGDYVDRGNNSIETILFLMCFKIIYPEFVHMIRGNHEFIDMCQTYGFYDECIERIPNNEGKNVFDIITATFPYLPLAALIQNSYLAVHGGISSIINSLDDIRNIENRDQLTDYFDNKIVTDLVWGDPKELPDGVLTAESERGAGEVFSKDKAKQFLEDNNLKAIIRAHESCENGFNVALQDPESEQILCLTIFSASNYCNLKNHGAFGDLNKEGYITLTQYYNVPKENKIPDIAVINSSVNKIPIPPYVE